MLRINLLGGFRVWVDSRLIPDDAWKRRKVQTLVKLLALTSRHCLHREQLMDLLWPEAEIEAARNNLRQTLHLARQILKSDANASLGILIDHNGWLCLTSEGETWVDAEVFESTVAECRRSEDTVVCQTALTLYDGELLPEDRYEDWVVARRELLRDLYLSLLNDLGNMFESLGDMEQAIDIFRQLVTVDSTAEHAHRALMRLYISAGFRQKALQQYHRLREILNRELGLDPDSVSRKLYEDILSDRFQTEITQK
ncbi:MAG: BTAD domain-containing putative transcriptional regulator [Anaerolineales bacterium]